MLKLFKKRPREGSHGKVLQYFYSIHTFFNIAGCEGIMVNIPVKMQTTGFKPEKKIHPEQGLHVYLGDVPSPEKDVGSSGPRICSGCSIELSVWRIEADGSIVPVDGTWKLGRRSEEGIINISPTYGHRVTITGLRHGTVRDIIIEDEQVNRLHLLGLEVK